MLVRILIGKHERIWWIVLKKFDFIAWECFQNLLQLAAFTTSKFSVSELRILRSIILFCFRFSKTDQYFAGEMFDMIQPLANGTYEIAMQRRYHAHNYTDYAGDLSFHCNLLVLMTSWRMGIKYKLFGESGCVQPPPPIHNGQFHSIFFRFLSAFHPIFILSKTLFFILLLFAQLLFFAQV